MAEEVAKYKNAKVAFVQEEPRNMGFWSYVAPRIATATRVINKKEVHPEYAGRLPAASPAAGSTKVHDSEVAHLLEDAFA